MEAAPFLPEKCPSSNGHPQGSLCDRGDDGTCDPGIYSSGTPKFTSLVIMCDHWEIIQLSGTPSFRLSNEHNAYLPGLSGGSHKIIYVTYLPQSGFQCGVSSSGQTTSST